MSHKWISNDIVSRDLNVSRDLKHYYKDIPPNFLSLSCSPLILKKKKTFSYILFKYSPWWHDFWTSLCTIQTALKVTIFVVFFPPIFDTWKSHMTNSIDHCPRKSINNNLWGNIVCPTSNFHCEPFPQPSSLVRYLLNWYALLCLRG